MNQRQKLLDILGATLVSVLLSWALTMMVADSMQLSAASQAVLLACLGVAGLTAFGLCSKLTAGIAAGVALIGSALWALSPAKPLMNVVELAKAFLAFGAGEQVMLQEHSLTIAVLLALLLTLVMHWLARMQGGVYPALTLSVIIVMASWLVDKRLNGWYIVPVVCALAAMFARAPDDRLPYLRALPAAAVAALLAFLLLPAGNPTWAPLKDAADRVRHLFYDYFLFTDTRVTFSLYPDGFQPMGEPLGGPADPSDGAVMLVESNDALLLRGSIKRTYTTYSWTNSSVNNRYLFVDPTKRSIRDQVFDSERLARLSYGSAFKEVTAKVTMLGDGISTLYTPHRLRELSAGIDNAIYYNTAGEVFITRGVKAGDSYLFTALQKSGGNKAVEQLLQAASAQDDPLYDAAMRDYMALPKGIENGVYELARSLTEGNLSPYQKALRLQSHLMKSYDYSLDVPYPPSNRDFVSYFLLSEKKGYCSYFASAMAVMGRIAGLPTRYIEGYMVKKPGPDGAVVTGRNAHAWVEVYFKGVGWISFNPTPGDEIDSGGSSGGSGDQGADQPEEPSDEPEPTATPGIEDEQPAEPDETEAPADQGDDGQDAAQDEQPEDNQDQPEDEPQTEDQPDEAERNQDRPAWLYVILILAALGLGALLIKERLQKSDPLSLEKSAESGAERMAIWYRALLLVLLQQGQAPNPEESPEQFALRLKESGLAGDELVYVAQQLTRHRYANVDPQDDAFARAAQAYQNQVRALKPMEKLEWYRKRMVYGIGDLERIP